MALKQTTLVLLIGAVLILGCGERGASPKLLAAKDSSAPWAGIPARVREDLSRGVNISTWFTHRGDAKQMPGWPSVADFSLMHRMGLRHIRLLVDAEWLLLNGAHPRELEEGINQALTQGLLVVLAMQPSSEHKQQMASADQAIEDLAEIWRRTARQFQDIGDDRLIFEVLNEPEIEDLERVGVIQQHLIEAIREISPARIVAVGGAHFSDIEDLVAMRPLKFKRVIYSFHFYEPHNFTHQGASWGWPMWMVFRNLPYPSSPENVAALVETLTPQAREHVAWYGQQAWNKQKLAGFVEQAARWSERNKQPVWCSEFGVLRDVAPPPSRRAWLHDARSLFEENNMAWTYFDWWGHFGLVTGGSEARKIDEDALLGLGLNIAEPVQQ